MHIHAVLVVLDVVAFEVGEGEVDPGGVCRVGLAGYGVGMGLVGLVCGLGATEEGRVVEPVGGGDVHAVLSCLGHAGHFVAVGEPAQVDCVGLEGVEDLVEQGCFGCLVAGEPYAGCSCGYDVVSEDRVEFLVAGWRCCGLHLVLIPHGQEDRCSEPGG